MSRTITDYLDQLASKQAAPGGGSAAALVASSGMALARMVLVISDGKKNVAENQAQISELIPAYSDLLTQCQAYMAKDEEAFFALMEAYGMPKESPNEQEYRSQTIQARTLACAEVPKELMGLIHKGLLDLLVIAEIGSKGVLSDATASAAALNAAAITSHTNVLINTKSLTDKEQAAELEAQAHALQKSCQELSDKAIQIVNTRLF